MTDPAIEPERRAAAVANELAREIRRLRRAADMSQRVLASKAGYSRQYVSMTEWQDATLPSEDLISAIDSALGAGGALIALRAQAKTEQSTKRRQSRPTPPGAGADRAREPSAAWPAVVDESSLRAALLDPRIATAGAAPSGHLSVEQAFPTSSAAFDLSELVQPDSVAALARSGPITERTLVSFTSVTRLLASQRQSIAPDALVGLIAAHRDSVAELFRAAHDDRIKGLLGALLGETSIVASRLWSAVGDRPMALANCVYARQLADKLHDPLLSGIARIFESNLRSDAATLIGADGDIVIGLRMLREAAAFGHALPTSAQARIAAEQAQAFAVLELPRECRKALTAAHPRGRPDRRGGPDRIVQRLEHRSPTCA
ncbi:helix-turn-helix transcriptional regulator [Nocardia sp. NPDC051981]|uniref:helix-turn-helix transcriptional regulator n=1 Tax=Nocardia sp. NPDC051981 TaxID=3155417 RepID=UPI00342127CE